MLAFSRQDLSTCDQQLVIDRRGGGYPTTLRDQGDPNCRVMQDYVACLKRPIWEQCGSTAWRHVREAFQRPASLYMPYCTLAGVVHGPVNVLCLLAIALLATFVGVGRLL